MVLRPRADLDVTEGAGSAEFWRDIERVCLPGVVIVVQWFTKAVIRLSANTMFARIECV